MWIALVFLGQRTFNINVLFHLQNYKIIVILVQIICLIVLMSQVYDFSFLLSDSSTCIP